MIRGHSVPTPASWATGHRIPRPELGLDDGAWAAWEWDGTTLTARTCPHGSIQLYYAVFHDGIALSPSIHDVLAAGADRSLDYEALAVLLRIGVYLAERTAFRGIAVLPPGATLTWMTGRLSIASSVRDEVPIERPVSFDEAVDGYLDLVAAAVRRRQPGGPFAMPLSGGRDSRHILLELLKQGHRPTLALTSRHYLVDVDSDVKAATDLAARFNLRHDVFSVPPYSFARQVETCRRVDYNSVEHAWALTLAERLKPFPVSFDGHGGSLYGRFRYGTAENLALARAGRYDELTDRMLASHGWVDELLSENVRNKMSAAVAAAELRTELARYRGWSNPQQGFWYWNRNRRATTTIPYLLFREIPTVFSPLDDHDLVQFALSVPSHLSIDRRWQPTAIRRGFPEAANLPFNEDLWPERRPSAWYAQRARHVHRARYAFDLLRVLKQRGSEVLDVKAVSKIASTIWLRGRGAQFETVPPMVTFLLTLEDVAGS